MAKIIVDFEINVKEALQNITDAKVALSGLREEQKALQKEILKGTATDDMKKRFGELTVEIRELTGVINTNNRAIQNEIKVQESAEGSLASYRAQIKNLKQAYAELSEEERNGAQGKELISKMDSLTNSAKAAEWQLQGVPKGLSKTVAAMSQVNFGAGRAAAGIAQLGKAFKALMANPIVLAIGAVVAVVKKLIDSFKKNDEAMTRLQKAMAPLKAVLSVVEKAFQAIVNVVSKVIEGIGNFASKIVSWIPGMKDYVDAQNDIVESTERLQDAERNYAVASAKRQEQISNFRNIATESEKYSVEQRRYFLERALQLEKEEAAEKKKIAEEKLRIAEKEALAELGYTSMTTKAWNELSDEQKNTLTELQVAVTSTTTEFNNATRRMTSQLNSFDKEIKREQEERAKAAAQAAKERIKNEKAALRELEDLTIVAMTNLQAKEEEQTRVSYRRRIEDIQERLKTEKNLTKKAKEALNAEIVLLETELQVKLGEIGKMYTTDRLKNIQTLYKQFYDELVKTRPDDIGLQVRISDFSFDSQIKTMKDQIVEIEKLLNDTTANLSKEQIDSLNEEKDLINNIIKLLYQSKSNAQVKIATEGNNAVQAVKKANEEMLKQIEDNKLLGAYYNNEIEKTRIFEEQARRRLQTAQDEVTRLKGLSEEQITALYGTEEKYRNALLNAENQVVLAQNNVEQAVRNTNKAIVDQQNKVIDSFSQIAQATGQVFGAFEDLFNNMAESDEKYAKYAKAMALMQVLVSTAISIANAIQGATAAAAATGPGAPIATPIFIAEMVAIVAGAIASAVGILKKAEKPSKPKFAEGGLVGDQVTERTDDTVDAKLSVGEFVVRSKAVKALGVNTLNTMNQTGMIPTTSITNVQQSFNMEAFRDIIVEAVSEVHPEVSVKEISSMQQRIQIKEEIAKY